MRTARPPDRVRDRPSHENAWALFLAVGGELLLQRRQLGERRIGIDRAIALAGRGARGERPVRRAALALVAPALVAAPVAVAFPVAAIALAVAAEFIVAAALLYLFKKDRRYLRFIVQVVRFTIYLLAGVLLFFLFERLVMMV